MSNVKSGKSQSPKTPGGISKSLLTPCRRVGLSRNWKRNSKSPFVSPLTGVGVATTPNAMTDQKEPKKRKILSQCDEIPTSSEKDISSQIEESICKNDSVQEITDIVNTPTRNVALPSRKKSKRELINDKLTILEKDNTEQHNKHEHSKDEDLDRIEEYLEISKPVKKKSRLKRKNGKSDIDNSPDVIVHHDAKLDDSCKENHSNKNCDTLSEEKPLAKCPSDLTKKCIVVIKKKVFKNIDTKEQKGNNKTAIKVTNSQAVFDSDDEVPLSTLNGKEIHKSQTENAIIKPLENDKLADDFCLDKNKFIVKKLHEKSPTTKISKVQPKKISQKVDKQKSTDKIILHEVTKNPENFIDDEDDFESKRTILIRKSYDKPTKPLKAKSTGSITKKDIDDLKARIEMKKKQILIKAMSHDTVELRELIKKWQKGCQAALMELLDLMKSKFPDKSKMDYSEMLQALKIPSSLVGYDEENDCFITPTDENIVLSGLNEI